MPSEKKPKVFKFSTVTISSIFLYLYYKHAMNTFDCIILTFAFSRVEGVVQLRNPRLHRQCMMTKMRKMMMKRRKKRVIKSPCTDNHYTLYPTSSCVFPYRLQIHALGQDKPVDCISCVHF